MTPRSPDTKEIFLSQGRYFFTLLFFGALLGGVFIFALFYLSYTTQHLISSEAERNRLIVGHQAIEREFKNVISDVLYLASSKDLFHYLANPGEATRNTLEQSYLDFSRYKPNYAQIRYLNETGQEVVRINLEDGQVNAVPTPKLQNKGARYYFEDSVSLNPLEVFISPLDLNTEGGVVQQPLQPVIRFASPIYDYEGNSRGIVLLNYFGDILLNAIQESMAGGTGQINLVNADGYWLIAPDPADEWGFMLEHDSLFSVRQKEAWKQHILISDQGVYDHESGLFSWKTIYPLQEDHFSSTGANFAGGGSEVLDNQGYFWKLITRIPREHFAKDIEQRVQDGVTVYLLFLGLLFLFSYTLSISRGREQAALNAQQENEQRLRNITAELADGLIVTDESHDITMMNREAEQLLGWEADKAVGKKLDDVIFLPGRTENALEMYQTLKQGKRFRAEDASFRTHNDREIPVAYKATPLLIDGQQVGGVITFQDISERKKAQQELYRLATYDTLTGLCNRREIDQRLAETLAMSERHDLEMSVLMLDIDFFKKINDNFGHQCGDDVLEYMGQALNNNIRDPDSAGRYGGEEFILLLAQTDSSQAQVLAERIRKHIETSRIGCANGTEVLITVSIGIASFPEAADNLDELISAADSALYAAKKAGRNQVKVAHGTDSGTDS